MNIELKPCTECGNMTTGAPDETPEDWHGLCPRCAFTGMLEGRLSRPNIETMLQLLAAATQCVVIGLTNDCDTTIIPTEDGVQCHVRMSLN